ncbi:MAG: hypothetical protein SNJ81_12940 [Cyanobacteriota bacterium]
MKFYSREGRSHPNAAARRIKVGIWLRIGAEQQAILAIREINPLKPKTNAITLAPPKIAACQQCHAKMLPPFTQR